MHLGGKGQQFLFITHLCTRADVCTYVCHILSIQINSSHYHSYKDTTGLNLIGRGEVNFLHFSVCFEVKGLSSPHRAHLGIILMTD